MNTTQQYNRREIMQKAWAETKAHVARVGFRGQTLRQIFAHYLRQAWEAARIIVTVTRLGVAKLANLAARGAESLKAELIRIENASRQSNQDRARMTDIKRALASI